MRRLVVWAVLLSWALCSASQGVASLTASETDGSAQYGRCGPMCASYVLRHFNKQDRTELAEIVSEIEQTCYGTETHLAAIAGYLHSKGVYTKGITARSGCLPNWPHPVIVHLRSQREGGMEHYVVLLPGDSRSKRIIWDGPGPLQEVSAWKLASDISEGALLISPVPIPETVDPYRYTADAMVKRGAITGILLCLAAFVVLRDRPR